MPVAPPTTSAHQRVLDSLRRWCFARIIRAFYAPESAGDLLPRYSFIEPLLADRRVLEIGAAAATGGASARYLVEHGAAAVVSIDGDGAAIESAAAANQHPFVKFLRADPSSLPRGSFDLAIQLDGGALAANPGRVAELKALLSPGGVLVAALPAAGGAGLPALAGTRPPAAEDVPPYAAFHGALAAHFAVVEIATQSAMVGYVLAAPGAGDGREPQVVLDGSLAGADEAAYYVAVCGARPSRLSGLTLVALPPRPLADAAVANAEAARSLAAPAAGPAFDASRLDELEAEAAAAAERAETLRGQLERERVARFEAQAVLEALQASEAKRGRESEEARATLARQVSEVERVREERAQAIARLEEGRARQAEAEASAQAALARAGEAEARCREAERALEARSEELAQARGAEAEAAAAVAGSEERAVSLGREVERLQAELSARQADLHAARIDAASTGEVQAEREALREQIRIQQARATKAEERAAEALARHGEAEARLAAEVERARAADERLQQVSQLARGAEARLAQAEARAAELTAEAARRTDEVTRRADQVTRHASAQAAQEEALRRMREEMARLQSQVALLEGRLREGVEKRAEAEAQAADARNAAEAAGARAAALEAELHAARRERDEIEQRLGAAQAGEAARSLEERIRSAELDDLRRQAAAHQAAAAELRDLRRQAAAHQADAAELRDLRERAAAEGAAAAELGDLRRQAALQRAAAAEQATRLEEAEASLAEAQRRQAEAEAARANAAAGIRQGDEAASKLQRQLADERGIHLGALAERDERISLLQREVAEAGERSERIARQAQAAEAARQATLARRRWLWSTAIAAAAMVLLALGFALGRRKAPDTVPAAGATPMGVPAREAAGRGAPVREPATLTASTVPMPGEIAPVTPLMTAPPLVAASPASAPCACPLILHEVRPGDRLWDLSAHYYRNPLKWKRLFRENRDLVADPDVIFPGQRIRVPDPRPPARSGRKNAAR